VNVEKVTLKMGELDQLEHLALVSKVCVELENNVGIDDKDLGK
jgi:ATP-dependent RNA helicase DHX8/PRP22